MRAFILCILGASQQIMHFVICVNCITETGEMITILKYLYY